MREPVIEFGAPAGVGDEFDAEADFGEGDGADVELIERLRGDKGEHLRFRPRAAQLGEDIRVEQPAGHRSTSRTGIAVALRLDVDVAVGRGLHRRDQRRAGAFALEAAEFFGGDDDDFIAAMHGDMLRPFAADAAHQLAELRLGVLKQPMAGRQVARAAVLLWRVRAGVFF